MDLGEEFAGGFNAIPIVTRVYLTGVALIAVLTHFEYLTTLQLYYHPRLVFERHQYWRLVTNFLYFGPINFDFLFHLFFMSRYFRVLEEQSYARKPADFLFMLLLGMACMLVVGTIFHIPFLSASLTFMVIYVWAKRNPLVMMNFLGFLNFQAPYMPFVLLGFSFLISGTVPKSDAIGIVIGHIYYYMVDVAPRVYGRPFLVTPKLLKRLIGQEDDIPITLREALLPRVDQQQRAAEPEARPPQAEEPTPTFDDNDDRLHED